MQEMLTHTWRLVVADSEDRWDVRTDIGKRGALLDSAANLLSSSPGNLGEVTPPLEVTHVWAVVTIAGIIHHLVIVHHVGDHHVNLVGCETGTDVLSVPPTTGLAMQQLVGTSRTGG